MEERYVLNLTGGWKLRVKTTVVTDGIYQPHKKTLISPLVVGPLREHYSGVTISRVIQEINLFKQPCLV